MEKHIGQGKRILVTALLLIVTCFITTMGEAGAASLPVATVKLSVEQVLNVSGTDAAVDTKTDYILKAEDASYPMPGGAAQYDFTIDGTAKSSIDLTFDHAGEYMYSISQNVASTPKGYSYDDETYTIKVYVRNTANGELAAEAVAERKDASKTPSLTFTNTYKPAPVDPEMMQDPYLKKTVEGSPASPAKFEFVLKAEDIANPMPEGSSNGVKKITVTGSGSAKFGQWMYTAAGTYKYTVSETDTGISGYTYDKTLYTVTDVVKDDGGSLVMTRKIVKSDGGETDSFTFTNTYSTSTGPKTGDFFNNTGFVLLVSISAVVIAACVGFLAITRRRKKKDEAQEQK